MDMGDLVHGPFNTREYIEYLGGMFGYSFTLDTYSMLPQFFGHEEEDPCLHLDRFEAVCGLCDDVGMSKKLRFMFFPLSLQSVAGDWCYAVSEWVCTWEQFYQAFIKHFLPIHQTFTHGPQGRLEPNFESHAFKSHTEPSQYASTSFDLHDPSFRSSICMETGYFAYPNLVPLTEGQHEEPQDYRPYEMNDAQLEETLHQFMQQQLSINNDVNQALNDIIGQISKLTQVMNASLSGNMTDLLTSGTTIGTEWDNCPNHIGDDSWDERLSQSHMDFPIQEISLPPTESQGDMPSLPTTELNAQSTQTTPGPIESLLTPFEQLHVTMPEEHIIESVDPYSLTYSPEVESSAHLLPLDSAPLEKFTLGIMSDHVTDHHWGEIGDIGGEYIDFLGTERLMQPTISMSLHVLWPDPRFQEPHSAFHSLMRPPSVLHGPDENIMLIKPFVDAWDRMGIG